MTSQSRGWKIEDLHEAVYRPVRVTTFVMPGTARKCNGLIDVQYIFNEYHTGPKGESYAFDDLHINVSRSVPDFENPEGLNKPQDVALK